MRVGTWNVGSMNGRGTEVCEELRKRWIDVCCLQEVRWRGQGARFMGMKGRRYKLWWSGNSDGTGYVRVLVKEELSEKIVEVRRKSDRVMTVVMAFEEEVRIICVYGPQSGRTSAEKERFYDDLRNEWDLRSMASYYWVWAILMDMLVNGLRVMRVCMVEMELGREMWKKRCC